jgi:hypothetical protein
LSNKPIQSGWSIHFSKNTARVLECHAPGIEITFTLDSGPSGDQSICLEHHPLSWPRSEHYHSAFNAAKAYLEGIGYEVEVDGEVAHPLPNNSLQRP